MLYVADGFLYEHIKVAKGSIVARILHASETFLNFTIQLYSCLFSYNAIFFIS